MQRLTPFALVGIVALALGHTASAATLLFQTVLTETTDICAAPCYQLRMFIEDPTRNVDIRGFHFSIDLTDGGSLAQFPLIGEPSSNIDEGYLSYRRRITFLETTFPWLSNTIHFSPWEGFDVQIVGAPITGSRPDADLNALWDYKAANLLEPCQDPVSCPINEPIHAAANLQNRLYLGRFNIIGNAGATGINLRIGAIVDVGGPELLADFQALDGAVIYVPYAPEPAGILLLGVGLAALGTMRLYARE